MKAPCQHREKNSRRLKLSFGLNSCYTSCLYNLIEGQQMCLWQRAGTWWRIKRVGGVISLQKPPQGTKPSHLQHPHSGAVLAKFLCPLPPHSKCTNQGSCAGTLGQQFEGQCWGIMYLTMAAWQSLPMGFWCPPEIPVFSPAASQTLSPSTPSISWS